MPLYEADVPHSQMVLNSSLLEHSLIPQPPPGARLGRALPPAPSLWLSCCSSPTPAEVSYLKEQDCSLRAPDPPWLGSIFWFVWGFLDGRRQMGCFHKNQFQGCYNNLLLASLAPSSYSSGKVGFTPAANSNLMESGSELDILGLKFYLSCLYNIPRL